MKVSPDSAGASALDVWLRAADPAPATPGSASSSQGVNAAAGPSAVTDVCPQPRDTAEDLLVLDIWNGQPAGPLAALHSLVATDATAQQWAEHIFSPLR